MSTESEEYENNRTEVFTKVDEETKDNNNKMINILKNKENPLINEKNVVIQLNIEEENEKNQFVFNDDSISESSYSNKNVESNNNSSKKKRKYSTKPNKWKTMNDIVKKKNTIISKLNKEKKKKKFGRKNYSEK